MNDRYRTRQRPPWPPTERGHGPLGILLRVLVQAAFGLCVAVAAAAEPTSAVRLGRSGLSGNAPLAIGPLAANCIQLGQYELFELTFQVAGTFSNPFDADQIDVSAQFSTPVGTTVTVPAFFYQDYGRSGSAIVPRGPPVWKVRFAPVVAGAYSCRVVARNAGAEQRSSTVAFTCEPRAARGYLRCSRTNPLYCEFENGKPYFPSGINIFAFTRLGQGIPATRLAQCEGWIDALAAQAGNFVRLRMDSWWLAMEMTPDEACGYLGLGYYQQQTCWELDRIYERAAAKGVYIMHCLDNANSSVNGAEGWRRPYNLYLTENGGVCPTAADFWSHPEARRQVRNKLRYCVARWAWQPNLMCWEFWNEVACRPGTIAAAVDWHRDMARYLRGIDPNAHPITTSLMGDRSLAGRIWELPEIDIAQHHYYSSSEMVPEIMEMTGAVLAHCRKPFFLGEYGVAPDFRPGNCDYDKTGVHMHNGMWAAAFAGGLGSGAMWYISNYVDPFELWSQYGAMARFADRVPWNAADLRPCPVDAPVLPRGAGGGHPIDVPLPTSMTFAFQKSPVVDFTVGPDGSVTDWEKLRPVLNAGAERKSPPTFHLSLKRAGQFVVKVTHSVGDATNRLRLGLDGAVVADEAFPAGKDAAPNSEYVEQYDNWRTPYTREVVVDVPVGDHTVTCEAVGKDRLEVEYELRGAVLLEEARPVRAFGFRTDRSAFLWFQNRTSTWKTAWEGGQPLPFEGVSATLRGLPQGRYTVSWYDTWAGRITHTAEVSCANGILTLALPQLTRDVACCVEGH